MGYGFWGEDDIVSCSFKKNIKDRKTIEDEIAEAERAGIISKEDLDV